MSLFLPNFFVRTFECSLLSTTCMMYVCVCLDEYACSMKDRSSNYVNYRVEASYIINADIESIFMGKLNMLFFDICYHYDRTSCAPLPFTLPYHICSLTIYSLLPSTLLHIMRSLSHLRSLTFCVPHLIRSTSSALLHVLRSITWTSLHSVLPHHLFSFTPCAPSTSALSHSPHPLRSILWSLIF